MGCGCVLGSLGSDYWAAVLPPDVQAYLTTRLGSEVAADLMRPDPGGGVNVNAIISAIERTFGAALGMWDQYMLARLRAQSAASGGAYWPTAGISTNTLALYAVGAVGIYLLLRKR